jgi:hypothetical protein
VALGDSTPATYRPQRGPTERAVDTRDHRCSYRRGAGGGATARSDALVAPPPTLFGAASVNGPAESELRNAWGHAPARGIGAVARAGSAFANSPGAAAPAMRPRREIEDPDMPSDVFVGPLLL